MDRPRQQRRSRFLPLAAWQETAPARPVVTRQHLVRQAMAILDETGFEGLTMRRLAERLGVQAASLYNHVRDKDELLALLADSISSELPPPDPRQPWRAQLEQMGRDFRRLLLAHRDAARVMAATPPLGPRRLEAIERLLGVLCRAGLSEQDVADAAFVFNSYVVGFVLDETQGVPAGEQDRQRLLDEGRQWFKSLPPEQFPRLVSLAGHLLEPTIDRRFEFGLQALLDGLELRLGSKARPTDDPNQV